MFDNLKTLFMEMGIWGTFLYALKILIPVTGMTYLFGRVFSICKTDNAKNFVAMITALTSIVLNTFYINNNVFNLIWNIFFSFNIVVILYVLIVFNLYSRVDSVLDKIAPDRPERKTRNKK